MVPVWMKNKLCTSIMARSENILVCRSADGTCLPWCGFGQNHLDSVDEKAFLLRKDDHIRSVRALGPKVHIIVHRGLIGARRRSD